MIYDFDTIIDRTTSDCDKYSSTPTLFGTDDVIPMWIADMDFASGDFIIEALKERADHRIFGYHCRCERYNQSIINWVARRSGWNIDSSWLEFSPGVVAGVTFAMLGLTKEGDGVLIQPPVYHPFAIAINHNKRKVINNPLRYTENGYKIDFEDLDRKLAQAKVFLMCNPHNPSGRCFTREELLRIGELCIKHDVKIISDEIHSDFVYAPHHHIHIASLSPELAERTITLIAPSKSFNIAGFCTAVAIIPNPKLKEIYFDEMLKIHVNNSNIMGAVALEAAYTKGEEWMEQVKTYLEANIDYCLDFLKTNIPSIKCHKPEATFLLWLDFSAWGMKQDELSKFLVEKARLGLNDGAMYGEQGVGFQRINIGAPRATIVEAMNRLHKAAKEAGLC